MIRPLVREIVLFLSVISAFFVSVIEIRSQSAIPQILSRIENSGKAIQLLRAEVTLIKFDVQLKVTDTTSGDLTYLPKSCTTNKRYVRVNWSKPVDEQWSMIGEDYELYRPKLKQAVSGKFSSTNGDFAENFNFLHMSKKDITASYSVLYTGQEQLAEGLKVWHLQLLPKTPMSFKSKELWISSEGMIQQFKITEVNGDSATIRLKNIENTTLEDLVFKLKYPNSVKKIKS